MSKSYPTIVALSSGAGKAGVAVVRISGPQTRFAFETIAGDIPRPREAALRRLRAGDGSAIDRALVLFFPAPASFTGEDVAEFHVHGSRAVLATLLAALTGLDGVRLAEPGEFTRRAFEAGKLDLAEVEGLADLIDSETEWQRRQALRQMEGALGQAVEGWRLALIRASALLAAELDFSDEGDVGGPLLAQARQAAARVLGELQRALGSFRRGEQIRDGFLVVLSGPPNAGKSSLLNALARRDVAIVSPEPGTTRDRIEVRLDLAGLPVILVDTAGLRDTAAGVEGEGIRRARVSAAEADLLLSLRAIDSDPNRDSFAVPTLLIASKADLVGDAEPEELPVSAQTGAGIDALLSAISCRLSGSAGQEPALLTRERHRNAVTEGIVALERFLQAEHDHAELLAEDLRLALRALERLVGRVDVEDVLDQLFAGFCIGK